jgi:hypothetical protein
MIDDVSIRTLELYDTHYVYGGIATNMTNLSPIEIDIYVSDGGTTNERFLENINLDNLRSIYSNGFNLYYCNMILKMIKHDIRVRIGSPGLDLRKLAFSKYDRHKLSLEYNCYTFPKYVKYIGFDFSDCGDVKKIDLYDCRFLVAFSTIGAFDVEILTSNATYLITDNPPSSVSNNIEYITLMYNEDKSTEWFSKISIGNAYSTKIIMSNNILKMFNILSYQELPIFLTIQSDRIIGIDIFNDQEYKISTTQIRIHIDGNFQPINNNFENRFKKIIKNIHIELKKIIWDYYTIGEFFSQFIYIRQIYFVSGIPILSKVNRVDIISWRGLL